MKKRNFGSGGTPSPRKSGGNAKGSKAVKKYAVGGNTKGIGAALARAQNFDRNTALRDFNAQARGLLKQGVPKAEIVKHQGILRNLQMDNSSTRAQHSAALSSALNNARGMAPQSGGGIGAALRPGAPSSGAPMLGRHGGSTGPARGGLSSLPGLASSFSGALASLRSGAPSSGEPMIGRHGGPSGPTSSGMSSGSGAPMVQRGGPSAPTSSGMQPSAALNAALRSGPPVAAGMKKGGKAKAKAKPVKKMAKGGSTASKRGDGCATKGKTKGKMV